MLKQTFIDRKIAPEFSCLNGSYCLEDSPQDNTIRLYKSSPEGATLQIRSHTGIVSNKTGRMGKKHKYIATVSYINTNDLRALRDGINDVLAEIEGEQ